MDIKQIKQFMAIMETGNITKAAEKLNMTQPPLTMQLKSLEEELGVRLFERSTRSLTPTDSAHLLFQRGNQIIELLETTMVEIQDISLGRERLLKVGFVASAGGALLHHRINEFCLKYPEVRLQLREGNTYKIIEMIQNGLIEIGFVRTPYNSEPFERFELGKEPMAVVYHKDFFINRRINEPIKFILNHLKEIPISFDFRFEKLIIGACHRNGFQPNIFCMGEDSRSLTMLSESGLSASIIPISGAKLISQKNLKISVLNEPALETQIDVVWLKRQPLSTIGRYFTKFLEIYND